MILLESFRIIVIIRFCIFKLFIMVRTVWSVNPACECIFFDGFGQLSNGSFTSPNYPVPYEPGLTCLLYTFVGAEDELIELTFYRFELQPPDSNGVCSDFVKIFHDLEEPAVNEDSGWQEIMCGRKSPPIMTFYSKGKALIFEFHSDEIQSSGDVGFQGEFRFLNRRDYLTSGNRFPHSVCNYHIKSSNEMKSGKIFSPHYPYYYPADVHCHYWITAKPNEYIKILVHSTDMSVTYGSCLKADDSLAIYDGIGRRLGDPEAVNCDPLLAHLCTKSNVVETVISSKPNLYMEFRSGKHSKRKGRGFYATFEFLDHLPRTSLTDNSILSVNMSLIATKQSTNEAQFPGLENNENSLQKIAGNLNLTRKKAGVSNTKMAFGKLAYKGKNCHTLCFGMSYHTFRLNHSAGNGTPHGEIILAQLSSFSQMD